MKNLLKCKMPVSFFLSLLLALAFISCSDISSKDSGEVSFSLSDELVRAVAARAASDKDGNSISYKIEFSMTGDVKKSESKTYTEKEWDSIEKRIGENGEQESFTFKNIPVGSKVKVTATISEIEENQALPFMKGESEEKKIEEGENSVVLKLKFIDYTLVVNFYLQNESDYVLSKEYSKSFKTDVDDFEKEVDEYISQFETQYEEKSYILFGEKAYIPNPSKNREPVIDSELYTITVNYYFDLANVKNGEIAVKPPVQKYTLAKNTAKSSKKFYKNYGNFVFTLLDEGGNDVLADVDWENEKNGSLVKRFVEFKKGNKSITSGISYDRNEVGISDVFPLNKSGTYQLTLTVSPLATEYVNTSGETVSFPSFEAVTGTFEIEVEDAYAFDVSENKDKLSSYPQLSSVVILGNVTDEMWTDSTCILYEIFDSNVETLTSVTFEGNVETPSFSDSDVYKTAASCYKESGSYTPKNYENLAFVFNGKAAIGDWSFNGLNGLTTLKFTTEESTIGASAFQAAQLISLDLTGVTSIGEYAFNNCSQSTGTPALAVTIPASVIIIRESAFASANIESVTFAVTEGWIGTKYSGAEIIEEELVVTDAASNAIKLADSTGHWVNMTLTRD